MNLINPKPNNCLYVLANPLILNTLNIIQLINYVDNYNYSSIKLLITFGNNRLRLYVNDNGVWGFPGSVNYPFSSLSPR